MLNPKSWYNISHCLLSKGLPYLGVALPFGMVLGFLLYLIWTALKGQYEIPKTDAEKARAYVLLGLLAALLAHFVEINFGIAIVSTRSYFWVYSGLLLCTGHILPLLGESSRNSEKPYIENNSPNPVIAKDERISKRVKQGRTRKPASKIRTYQNKEQERFQDSSFSIFRLPGWIRLALMTGSICAILLTTLGFLYVTNSTRSDSATGTEFGWSRVSISLAFFLNSALWALSLVFVGKVYDRFGPRWVIIVGTVFISTGYALISIIDSLWQFYICYGVLVAIGLGGTAVPLIAALMSNWFVRSRGLAISLALSENCLGQFALVPLFTLFALKHGWRTSYLAIGLIMFAVNVTMALLVVKGNPRDLGTDPFGYSGRERPEGNDPISAGEMERDLNLREAMRTYSFWLFLFAMFVCGSGDFLVTTHLIPHVTDDGISPTTPGNMLAWFGLMALGGVLVAGPASDLIGNKIPLALTFLMRVLSFLLILNYQSAVSFYIFSLTFGFTYLITGTSFRRPLEDSTDSYISVSFPVL